MIKRIVPILIGASIVAALLLASKLRSEPMKVSGFIEAHEIRLGSRVGGRVAQVHVEEGDAVSAGQVLVELEPFDLLAREAEAQANLAAYRAEFEKLEVGFRPEEVAQAKSRVAQLTAEHERLVQGPRQAEIEAARAQAEVAKARVTLAERVHQRTQELVRSNSISAQELDRAVEELEAARGTLLAQNKELQLLEEGSRKEGHRSGSGQTGGVEGCSRHASGRVSSRGDCSSQGQSGGGRSSNDSHPGSDPGA